MLVVFEGPNGAGKSTLLRALAALRPRARVLEHPPKSPPPGTAARVVSREWPHAETTHAEYQALRCADVRRDDVFVDRLWVTDAVYGRVFRRPPYDRSYVRPVEDFGAAAFVVHVTVGDVATLARRLGVSEADPLWEFLGPIRAGFFDYFRFPPEGAACPYETVYTDLGVPPEAQAGALDASLRRASLLALLERARLDRAGARS